MDLTFQYSKKRVEFGHFCQFEDAPSQILESIPSSNEYENDYIKRNPCTTTLDTTVAMAEHEVCTDRVIHRHQGLYHFEGGWPENVDATEVDQVDRYLKKAVKDVKIRQNVQQLASRIENAVKQNNTIDIYEMYFEPNASAAVAASTGAAGGAADAAAAAAGTAAPATGATGGAGTVAGAGTGAAIGAIPDIELSSEPPSARGLSVFRDPASIKRTATSINWHPEGNKIAVSYSLLKFQDERAMHGRLPTNSYIWDLQYPNNPIMEVQSPSPLVCLRYNTKTPDILVGGCYNGLVGVFDAKKPRSVAIQSSPIDKSHHDPVYDVYWVQSKTNSQFVSVSTDGQMMWWDIRKLTEPTDVLQLNDGNGRVLGGCSLEYNVEAGPAKYLVGTEQGVVLSMNMRKRGGGKDAANTAGLIQVMDTGPGRHHGPIYSIHRNPAHPTAYMTVGDWTARIWNEKNKGPVMMTPYSKSYLTAGSWSPTRPGVFYTCRQDGVLDVWDYFNRQNAVAYSHKVSDVALSSISIQGNMQNGGGKLVAVGDVNGTVSLLEVSDNLAVCQASEKVAIGLLFDRESKREENLEKRAQALARLARAQSSRGEADLELPGDDFAADVLKQVDADFDSIIKHAEEEEAKIAEKAAGASANAAGLAAAAMSSPDGEPLPGAE